MKRHNEATHRISNIAPRWALLGLACLGRAAIAGPAVDKSDPAQILDHLHAERDAPGALDRARQVADAAVAAQPSNYQLLWRAARVYFSLSDESKRSKDDRSRFGTIGWELGQRAASVNPQHVAAHYWSALAVGSSSLGMGILRAVANDIEGKFRRELSRATELDPTYDHGNVYVAWGAYYKEVPWPKRDRQRSREYLTRALSIKPDNLRARFYLAELDRDEKNIEGALAELRRIAAAPGDSYDPPEERWVKAAGLRLAETLNQLKSSRRN